MHDLPAMLGWLNVGLDLKKHLTGQKVKAPPRTKRAHKAGNFVKVNWLAERNVVSHIQVKT